MANVKLVNGLALASMKTFDGLAAASVKTIYGVDATSGTTVPDPIYQWDFEENTGTTATDSVSAATLTLHPTDSVWQGGHVGFGIGFAGVGSSWVDGTDVFNALRTTPFSLSLWVSPFSIPTTAVIFFNGTGFQGSGAYTVLDTTGQVTFVTNQTGANQSSSTSVGAISTGTWQHICITRSGSSVKIYINGSDATTTSASHVNPDSGNGSMRLGSYNTILPYTGGMDQFYIYDVELSSAEVAQLYIDTQ